jgi:hypothetical protein
MHETKVQASISFRPAEDGVEVIFTSTKGVPAITVITFTPDVWKTFKSTMSKLMPVVNTETTP